MFHYSSDIGNRPLYTVEPVARRIAARRHAEVRIHVTEPTGLCLCGHHVTTTVSYTWREFTGLYKPAVKQIMSGLKSNAFGSAMTAATTTLWGRAHPDQQYAMGILGPSAVYELIRYQERDYGPRALVSSWLDWFAGRGKHVRLEVLVEPSHDVQATLDNLQCDPPPPQQKHEQEKGERNDPQQGAELGEVVQERAIMGLNFSDGRVATQEDGTPTQVATVIGPLPCIPRIPANTSDNINEAITERIVKRQRKVAMTTADKRRIGDFTKAAIRKVFTPERMAEWASEYGLLDDIKSGKWSASRLESALQQAYGREAYFQLKAAIKFENMPDGKPPRMLIADGDLGQLYALAVIHCFEWIVFHPDNFEKRSIKHVPRKQAFNERVATLKGAMVEGDGSAWDTTCSAEVRSCTENPILRHIMMYIKAYHIMPEQWMSAHDKICSKAQLKLHFNTHEQQHTWKMIDAIRRSGHRGTSCLNWWVNHCLWYCSVFERPEQFIVPTRRKGLDVTGVQRRMTACFEGDDSAVGLEPKVSDGEPLALEIRSFWERCGFNMKLIFVEGRMEFCGTHFTAVNGRLDGGWCPDLPRCIKGSSFSTSKGNLEEVAAASYLSRAYDFAGILPRVSEKFLAVSRSWTGRKFKDRELEMRTLGSEKGRDTHDVIDEINMLNAECGISAVEELGVMKKLGYECTEDELSTWLSFDFTVEPNVTTLEAYKEALPASWR